MNKSPTANAGDTGSTLAQEDSTCHGATKLTRRNHWACALEPVSRTHGACVLQLACAPRQEKPPQWEAHTLQQRVAPIHQLEKAQAEQRRPSAAKNKNKF